MSYTLGSAAKATGKSKTTIHRAIKSGRISASCDDTGTYQIDPAELHRVFPPVSSNSSPQPEMVQSVTHDETRVLRRELEVLREERERERNQLQNTIGDLQKDRDHWRQQATHLLEDKREKEALQNGKTNAKQELQAHQEHTAHLLSEAQTRLEKVHRSWIGRLLFKV